jgi:hemerythrin-like domain-containing protein
MSFRCQVNHTLDSEHQATLDMLGRLEQLVVRAPQPGTTHDPEFSRLARLLAEHIERDIERHFDFEERELFPRLEAAGDGDIVELLMEEHRAIRPVLAELLPLAKTAGGRALEAGESERFKRGALEMIERLTAHIQKETMGLMPMIDDILDDDIDRELTLGYATA